MHSSTATSHLDDLKSFLDQMSELVHSASSLFQHIQDNDLLFDINPDDLASASFMTIALTSRLRHMQEAYRG